MLVHRDNRHSERLRTPQVVAVLGIPAHIFTMSEDAHPIDSTAVSLRPAGDPDPLEGTLATHSSSPASARQRIAGPSHGLHGRRSAKRGPQVLRLHTFAQKSLHRAAAGHKHGPR